MQGNIMHATWIRNKVLQPLLSGDTSHFNYCAVVTIRLLLLLLLLLLLNVVQFVHYVVTLASHFPVQGRIELVGSW
jgi:hypothetical protein